MPAPMDPKLVTKYDRLLIQEGCSVEEAANRVGVSVNWGYRRQKILRQDGVLTSRQHAHAVRQGGPIPYPRLNPKAKRAHDDFAYFRRRYFGYLTYGWQAECATALMQALESDRREFIVVNCPPGAGKTQMVRHIAMWLTIRRRNLRGLVGSRTQNKATKIVNQMRRDFERSHPIRADENDIRLGYAVDAQATLVEDFGLFKPLDMGEPWRQDAFVVVQPNMHLTTEKEHTWSAYGLDTDYLGDRVDIAIWDDAQNDKDLSSVEKIEAQRKNFDTIAETRLEPRGVLFLVGQRLGADDIYRHCLDKIALPDDDDELDALDAMSEDERSQAYEGLGRKYRHIKYPAHFDDRCNSQHAVSAPQYPEGCLLAPNRLPWRDLRALKHNDPNTFEVLYQQEDTAAGDTLAKRVWVEGGTDPETGSLHFGCRDIDRGLNEIPAGLTPPLFHIAAIDPSPTRFWAVQSWVVAPQAGKQIFLMETVKKKLRADEVLDWNQNQGRFVGIMEEWQTRSERLGLPISAWVVERNGAQRFLLQYDHVRRWVAEHLTTIVPHDTAGNKHDPDYGVWTVREWWRSGRVRLPYRGDEARLSSLKLIDEALKYPHGVQDDQVMAMWFLTSHLEQLTIPKGQSTTLHRPSWLSGIPDARRLVAVP